ncbi:retrovirus-related Pol polyprotein from transposon 412 [Trichonephila clavipes]|nr:retrovirus-related Pol polyprotein from transposon 412 [Trichonephila clavipes]
MDKQLKALLEGINALKNGQEETQKRMENMQNNQKETNNESKDKMEKCLENVQKYQVELKISLDEKINKTKFESNQKIIAKPNIPLSPRTECIIPGLVAENRKFRFGLIDYPYPDSLKAGLLIASSVVYLSNPVIPVRIGNISDQTKTIQKREVIAVCAPVTCVDRKSNSQVLPSEDLGKDLLQNTYLDDKQRCAAGGLIKELQGLFSRTSEDFGRARLTKHRIDMGEHPHF